MLLALALAFAVTACGSEDGSGDDGPSTANKPGDGKPAAKKASRTAKEPAPKATTASPAEAEPIPEKSSPSGNGTSIRLDDILALKGLVGRVGVEDLRKLIDLVG